MLNSSFNPATLLVAYLLQKSSVTQTPLVVFAIGNGSYKGMKGGFIQALCIPAVVLAN